MDADSSGLACRWDAAADAAGANALAARSPQVRAGGTINDRNAREAELDSASHESTKPSPPQLRRARERLSLRGELAMAALPTATVLCVLAAVESLTSQRVLFASLAASAFLIYLDPEHGTNRARALVTSQVGAAALGWLAWAAFGGGYAATAVALVCTIFCMVALDVVHPPAVGTAMSFALRAGSASNLAIFALAVGITVLLLGLQRAAVWMLTRFRPAEPNG